MKKKSEMKVKKVKTDNSESNKKVKRSKKTKKENESKAKKSKKVNLLPPPPEETFEDIDHDLDDQDDDEGDHGNFLKDMAEIDGKPKFLHHNVATDVSKLPIDQLLGAGGKKGHKLLNELLDAGLTAESNSNKELKKSLLGKSNNEGKKSKKRSELTLEEPLSAPDKERAIRSALYKKSKSEVGQWDAVVHSSRAAESKSFPIKKPDLRLETPAQAALGFRPANPLEAEVMNLLKGSKANEALSKRELTRKEEEYLAKMSLREAEEKRKELIKLKLLQQYQERKISRQNKIKSRKYRKLMRKQKQKEEEKELEELRRTNPDLALERMEKSRILERATLRHRNNSKYLQMLAQRGDKESQVRMQEVIRNHRAIVAKDDQAEVDDDDDERQNDEEVQKEDFDQFNEGFKEFLTAEKKKKKKTRKTAKEILEHAQTIDDLFSAGGKIIKHKINPESDNEEESDVDDEVADEEEESESEALELRTKDEKTQGAKKVEQSKTLLDPDVFVKATNVTLPTLGAAEEIQESDESDDDNAKAIAEAFADDDVLGDFSREKAAELEKSRPKDIDLTLPGWNSWGGEGIKISKRKRKRFTIKAGPAEKRRDENKGQLILNDEADSKAARKHLVSSVPFPFTSVADYEASIRTPVGETFVPRSSFKKFVKPAVVTKKGAVIEPMDRDELVKRGKTVREQEIILYD